MNNKAATSLIFLIISVIAATIDWVWFGYSGRTEALILAITWTVVGILQTAVLAGKP